MGAGEDVVLQLCCVVAGGSGVGAVGGDFEALYAVCRINLHHFLLQ